MAACPPGLHSRRVHARRPSADPHCPPGPRPARLLLPRRRELLLRRPDDLEVGNTEVLARIQQRLELTWPRLHRIEARPVPARLRRRRARNARAGRRRPARHRQPVGSIEGYDVVLARQPDLERPAPDDHAHLRRGSRLHRQDRPPVHHPRHERSRHGGARLRHRLSVAPTIGAGLAVRGETVARGRTASRCRVARPDRASTPPDDQCRARAIPTATPTDDDHVPTVERATHRSDEPPEDHGDDHMEHLTLNNGVEMPALGLGVFQTPPDETRRRRRGRAGDRVPPHRHRRGLRQRARGRRGASAASGLDRDEVFIETKIWISDYGYDQTLHALREERRQAWRRADRPADPAPGAARRPST